MLAQNTIRRRQEGRPGTAREEGARRARASHLWQAFELPFVSHKRDKPSRRFLLLFVSFSFKKRKRIRYKKAERNARLSCFAYVKLSCENTDLVAEEFCDEVNDPEDETDAKAAKNTNNESKNILCFNETNDSVNRRNDTTEEELKNQFYDLGKVFISSRDRSVSHFRNSP